MSTEPRDLAVTKYFKKTPNTPTYGFSISFIVSSVPFVFFGVIGIYKSLGADNGCLEFLSATSLFLGIILLVLAMTAYKTSRSRYVRRYWEAEPKPSDAQIDAWHQTDIAGLREFALSKLDLVPEEVRQYNKDGPLQIIGPGPSPEVRIGSDGVARFSRHNIVFIYLTRYHFGAFQCVKELVNGGLQSYSTQEYHYDDVQAVSTHTDNSGESWLVHGERVAIPGLQKFSLSVASGEKIEVAIDFSIAGNPLGQTRFSDSGAELAIRTIRSQLREMKGGTQDLPEADIL